MSAKPSAVPAASCAGCPAAAQAPWLRLGIDSTGYQALVALAGNPNTGKSTLFNTLTGLRQHTGNWAGKTVSRAEGGFAAGDRRYKLIDLPGTYSLLSTSSDEEIARDFILFGQPDVTVVVVDATRLERNLNLTLQVLEITDRVVVALNLIDEAERHGLQIDERRLMRELGVPVVPIAARQRRGLSDLIAMIERVALGQYPARPRRSAYHDPQLDAALTRLVAMVEAMFPGLPNARWVALRLLDGDESVVRAVRSGTLGDLGRASVGADDLIRLEVAS